MIKIKKFLKNLVVSISIISFGIFLVLNPENSIKEIRSGINICCNILIPSLFPSFMINSGVSNILGKIFYPISKYLFKLPPQSLSVIFLSLVGGFPVGAKGISDLFEKKMINEKQANRMLCFCVNAGPAFILGVIGNSLIKNIEIARMILFSQIISSLFIGILISCFSKEKIKNCDQNKVQINFTESLINSCESSSIAIINMCTLIIIFNLFSGFLINLHFFYIFSNIFSSFRISNEISECFPQIIIEVTKACEVIVSKCSIPYLLSFATSWGGICVHLQVFSIMKKIKINYINFFIFRFLNAVISSFLTFLFIKFRNLDWNIQIDIPKTSANFLGSLVLVICCLIFLIDLNFKKLGGSRDEKD